MAKSGPSFGMILLLVVMAVVLVLVANAWKSMAPAALDVNDAANSGPIDDHGQPAAAEAVREGGMPNLRQTQAETDAHAADVGEALEAIE